MEKQTQEDMVLGYLMEHESGMTSLIAFECFGIMQMPKRIFNLKKRGYRISATPKTGKNRFGKAVHYVVYKLEAAA